MNLKFRLTLMSFLQFFVWGAWLITIANYWFGTKQWAGDLFGWVFSTLAISSLVMPALTGIIADKWINAEKLYGILHLGYAATLMFLPQINDPVVFIFVMGTAMLFYMPTISLSNSVAYSILKNNNYDVVKVFPPIRVWGTIGFILAMWTTNLSGNKATANQFYIAAVGAILLGIYSFTLPQVKPENKISENATLSEKFGLNAFKLFKDYKFALFFLFSMMLGAALQLTNMYGDVYISDFGNVSPYKNIIEVFNEKYLPQIENIGNYWDKLVFILSNFNEIYPALIVKYSTIIMSISQISETLFILAIPFFLKRFGIKKVMIISMIAWVLRFGLFSFGNPAEGLWMIIVSCIVYGMAFDFFNISGSLFVETNTDSKIRSSAQGLFMMMTNGFGAIMGSLASGYLIKNFFTAENGDKMWHEIWLVFAAYALVVAILFAIMFKHKHDPNAIGEVKH
jgi:NHS family xanthosine MFS transporter